MRISRNRNASLTVGTTIIEASPQRANEERTIISFTNVSTGGQVIGLAIGGDASVTGGIVIYPGGFYNESREGLNKATQEQITTVANLAGAILAIQERVEMNL